MRICWLHATFIVGVVQFTREANVRDAQKRAEKQILKEKCFATYIFMLKEEG